MILAKKIVIFGGTISILASLAFSVAAAAGGSASVPTALLLSRLAKSKVSDHTLGDMHGRNIPANPAQLGTVDNNVSSGVTGSVNDYGSVTGNQGITTVIQNTGNNDLFQTLTTVNIHLNN